MQIKSDEQRSLAYRLPMHCFQFRHHACIPGRQFVPLMLCSCHLGFLFVQLLVNGVQALSQVCDRCSKSIDGFVAGAARVAMFLRSESLKTNGNYVFEDGESKKEGEKGRREGD